MPAVARPRSLGGSGNYNNWDRARLSVVVPIGVIVAVAIVCIVVAVLSSAQRADEVAVEHEKQLFSGALTNYGRRVLSELDSVASSQSATQHIRRKFDPVWTDQRAGAWLAAYFKHDYILVFDGQDNPVYSMIGHAGRRQGLVCDRPARTDRTHRLHARPQRRHAGRHQARSGRPEPARRARPRGGDPQYSRTAGGRRRGRDRFGRRHRREYRHHRADHAVGQVHRRRACSPASPPQLRPGQSARHCRRAGAGRRFRLRAESPQWRPHRPLRLDGETARRRNRAERRCRSSPLRWPALRCWRLSCCATCAAPRSPSPPAKPGCAIWPCTIPLCGLPNRIFFGERLEAVIGQVHTSNTPAAVFYIDLDHFKDVNDTLGHPVGDELIRNVTLRLSHTLRGGDLVARLGGDEFAVISANRRRHRQDAGAGAAHHHRALRALHYQRPEHRHRRLHRHRRDRPRLRRLRRHHALCRHGALPRQERRPQPRLHL